MGDPSLNGLISDAWKKAEEIKKEKEKRRQSLLLKAQK
jgi:hypothetical protein